MVCLVAYFSGEAFLANGVPHFVSGMTGKGFQSPFALPPGVGESSPLVNVIWGLVNFFAGYALISGVNEFCLGFTRDALLVAIGAVVAAVFAGRVFWAHTRALSSPSPGGSGASAPKQSLRRFGNGYRG